MVDQTIADLLPALELGDMLIDGGNSYYIDDIRRAKEIDARGSATSTRHSGGVWGLERGYCMMIGGDAGVVKHLDPIFATLAPGDAAISRGRPDAKSSAARAEQGYLHCGPNGAGHFVKMVHNGIEYGVMAAYAEGIAILQVPTSAARGRSMPRPHRCAIPNTISTISTCPTLPRSGGAAA